MKPDIEQLEAELHSIETRAAALRKKLEAAKRKAEKWHPSVAGGHFISGDGEIGDFSLSINPSYLKAGSYYQTQEAADAANRRITFFRRLCAMATELNPSKRPASGYQVVPFGEEWDYCLTRLGDNHAYSVFETREAAQRAAEIMTRDGWTVENGGGFFDE